MIRMAMGFSVAFVLALGGCEVSPEEAEELAVTWLDEDASARIGGIGGIGGGGSGDRCTTFDGTTTGCEDDEICLPIACTNSIPPVCFGFCQSAPGFP